MDTIYFKVTVEQGPHLVPGGWVVWSVCVAHPLAPCTSSSRSPYGLGPCGLKWRWARQPITVQHSPSRWVVDIYHPHLVTCQVTILCSQSLCQAIRTLLSGADKSKADDPSIKFLLDKEAVNLHMFCPIMLNGVISNAYS